MHMYAYSFLIWENTWQATQLKVKGGHRENT